MKRADYIEEGYFLEALRTGGTFSADYESLYGQPDTLQGKDRMETYQRDLARFVSAQAQEMEPITGADLVSDLVRRYTEEWLATGLHDPDGKEHPLARKLTATTEAWKATRWYENTQYWIRIDWDNGLQRRPKTIAERFRFDLKEGDTTVERYAKIRAAGIFHAFMQAPWRYKLGKCKRCYCYFVLNNMPTKKPYVRGMHCPACKNAASAEASARTRRGERENELIGLAAEAWSSWHPNFGEPKEWVAKEVRAKLGLKLGQKGAIQRSWITRHEKDIKAEMKRRARAKS